MTAAPLLSVVIPVRNEGRNIERVLRELERYAPPPHEVLVVYDDESDDTLPVVRRLQAELPCLRLVPNERGRGVLNALRSGFAAATGRFVLVTMGDSSDRLSDLPPMLALAESGAAVVAASRYVRGGAQLGGPRLKSLLSRSAGLLLHALAGLPIHDPTSNFKLYARDFLQSVHIESRGGFEVALELSVKAHRRGLRLAEVPTVWRDRTAGRSKFALLRWLPHYLRWFLYGLATRALTRPDAARADAERRPRPVRRYLATSVVAAAASWALYVWAARPHFALADSAWLSDVARHVARGDGLTTNATLPVYLPYTLGAPLDRNPQLQSPPGYPLLLGLAFKLGGVSETSTLVLQGVLFVALVAMTYLVARRFLDAPTATLAAAVVALEPNLLRHAAAADLNLAFAVAFMVVLAIVSGRMRGSWRVPVVAGLALGLSQLLRFNALTLLPAFVVFVLAVAGRAERSRRGVAFVAGWLVAALATVAVSSRGSLGVSAVVNLLLETPTFPAYTVQGALAVPTLAEALTEHFWEIAAKELAGLRFYTYALPAIGDPLLTGGAFIAAIGLTRVPRARPLLLFAAVAVTSTVLVVSGFEFSIHLVAFLTPLLLLLAVWGVREFAGSSRLALSAVLLVALALYAGETVRLLRGVDDRAQYAREISALAASIRAGARDGDWIASDISPALAWHTDLPTVRLPNHPEDLQALARLREPVTLVVITNSEVVPLSRKYPDDAWLRVLETGVLPGYRLEQRVEGRHLQAVIFRSVARDTTARGIAVASANSVVTR